jgi:tetratricopeptide (TPR) repeat protein
MISFNLGNSYKNQKNYSKAINFFEITIEKAPNYLDAYKKKGELLTNLNNHKAALDCFKKAIKLAPEDKVILNGIGVNLLELEDANNALIYFKKCISIDKTIAIFYNNAGLAEYKINAFKESIKSFNKAIKLSPTIGYFYSNRGLSYQALKKFDFAIKDFNKCISITPDYPDAYWNKSLINLYQGNYADGWKLYEYRWQSFAKKWLRTYDKKLWLGNESLENKTIFIYPEQGHGDFIQCYRYIALLKKMSPKQIIIEVTIPFYNLIRAQDDELVVINSNNQIPKFDFYCPIMSLPHAFKTEISSIPNECPYIFLNDIETKKQRNKSTKSKLKIGVCWAGNKVHKNDHNRSMSISDMSELFSLPFEFHSLQKEVSQENLAILKKFNVIDYHHSLNNFTDTANLIDKIDIIISVDTVISHLAGALGKKTFLLLPDKSSFLWMEKRDDSPWYPTIKIFRQSTLGDWQTPIKKIKKELKSC